MISIYCKNRYL